jgi:zinc/manganese transport system substrate-binding protein
VVATVIPGGTTLGEPSSAELAELVALIGETGAPAIFAENVEPSTLAEAVAAEVESDVAVVELYTDSLGEEGSGADTLIGMLLTNADRIVAALP